MRGIDNSLYARCHIMGAVAPWRVGTDYLPFELPRMFLLAHFGVHHLSGLIHHARLSRRHGWADDFQYHRVPHAGVQTTAETGPQALGSIFVDPHLAACTGCFDRFVGTGQYLSMG